MAEPRDDDDRSETQEERAMRTLQAIWAGGDLTEETMKLSNEFTDRHAERMFAGVSAAVSAWGSAWVRRIRRRRG